MKDILKWPVLYCMSALAACNAHPNDNISPFEGAQTCRIEFVRACANNLECLNQRNARDETILMLVVEKCDTPIVRLVAAKATAINARDTEGGTALMRAAARGSLETVQILADQGADINAESEYNQTALSAAIESRNPRVVEYLLKKGACTTRFNFEGMNYKQMAEAIGSAEIQSLLEENRNSTCTVP